MTLTEDVLIITDGGPLPLDDEMDQSDAGDSDLRQQSMAGGHKRIGRIGGAARRVLPRGGVVTSALAMSAACLGTLLAASAVHSGSPWTGLNALPRGLPLISGRPSTGFDIRLAAIGLGTIVG